MTAFVTEITDRPQWHYKIEVLVALLRIPVFRGVM
jgi:hypothetical protein